MDWASIGKMALEMLKWLVPAGSIFSFIWWFYQKTEKELNALRKEHDTYRQLYADIKETLIQEVAEKRGLRRVIARLERAISQIPKCKYFDDCPVDRELKQSPEPPEPARARRQVQPKPDEGENDNK